MVSLSVVLYFFVCEILNKWNIIRMIIIDRFEYKLN